MLNFLYNANKRTSWYVEREEEDKSQCTALVSDDIVRTTAAYFSSVRLFARFKVAWNFGKLWQVSVKFGSKRSTAPRNQNKRNKACAVETWIGQRKQISEEVRDNTGTCASA